MPDKKLTREQAAQIRSARLAAAVRKVKEGKALTLGEQTLIDSMTEPDRADRATWPKWCSSQAQASAITGIPLAAVRAAKRQGCPAFDHSRVNPRAMVEWIESRPNPQIPATPAQTVSGAQPIKRTLAQEIEDLNAMLAQVDSLARDAMARGDVLTASALADQSKGWWERRKAAQVELRRQGKTEDDAVNRNELERIIHAITHHVCVGLQAVAVDIVRAIEGETDPARQLPLVEGALVPSVLVAPMEQSGTLAAGHGLPSWAVDCVGKALREVAR